MQVVSLIVALYAGTPVPSGLSDTASIIAQNISIISVPTWVKTSYLFYPLVGI